MPTILDRIVADKEREVAAAKQRVPEEQLREALSAAPPVRDFFAALDGRGTIRLIAEVKKASPSKGVIRAISIRWRLPSHISGVAQPSSAC